MSPDDIQKVLHLHTLWVDGSDEGMRADMCGANLRGADMRGADLSGADGLVLLTESDHGYIVYATRCDAKWRIHAGCRDFSLAEALAHWGSPDYHTPISGRRIIACLDWFERELAEGNIK